MRKRRALLIALVLVISLPGVALTIGAATPRELAHLSAGDCGCLEPVDPLSLHSESYPGVWPPCVGRKLIVHMKVRNTCGHAVTFKHLGIQGRRDGDPTYWDIIPENVTIPAGGIWSHDANNERPLQPGSYTFQMTCTEDGSSWRQFGNILSFTASPSCGPTPTPTTPSVTTVTPSVTPVTPTVTPVTPTVTPTATPEKVCLQGFSPARNGWHFKNWKEPSPDDKYTIDDMRKMFGDGAVCDEVRNGQCEAKKSARQWRDKSLKAMRGGLCYGMAVTSLQRFVANRPPPSRKTPLPDDQSEIARYFVQFDTAPAMCQKTAPATAADAVANLRAAISGGAANGPILSMYWLDRRLPPPYVVGHSVTPYCLEYSGNDRWHVLVYDNNYPDTTHTVEFDVAAGTFTYSTGGYGGQVGPKALNGYPSVVIDRLSGHGERQLSFGGRGCPGETDLMWVASVWLEGSGSLLVSDHEGRRIGHAGEMFVNEIPGANASFLPVDIPLDPVYSLPLSGTYAILLDGSLLSDSGSASVTQLGPEYALAIDGITLAPGDQDRISFDMQGSRVTYAPARAQQVDLVISREPSDGSDVFYVTGMDVGPGRSVTLENKPELGTLSVNNSQGTSGSYGLELKRFGKTGSARFQNVEIEITGGDTHLVEYKDWDGNGPMRVLVDGGSDGTIDDTLILDNHSPHAIPAAERAALVALHNRAAGAHWLARDGWLERISPCQWYGVTCADGHVTALDLSSNGLSGTIPPEIGNLAQLVSLDLSDNQLTGSVPASLGGLSALEDLDLSDNKLLGALPASMGNLTRLIHMDLSYNWLSGMIPPELGQLGALQTLSIEHNDSLTGTIPSEIGSLHQLRTLNLRRTNLGGTIPETLGDLANLETLKLGWGRLGGTIPSSFGRLSYLKVLDLAGNQLEGDVPTSMCGLGKLEILDIGYNKLTASDPCVLAWLDALMPNWAATQTVPPTGLTATSVTQTSARLTWNPILFSTGSGYYEIGRSATPGGPYKVVGRTTDKTQGYKTVNGLGPCLDYLVVRTYSAPHPYWGKVPLWSDWSEPLHVTLLPLPIGGLSATNDSVHSPTTLGHATTLTATVSSGCAITYSWGLGDGESAYGAVVTHVYPVSGTYTAVVTASNPLGKATANTMVRVRGFRLVLPLISKK